MKRFNQVDDGMSVASVSGRRAGFGRSSSARRRALTVSVASIFLAGASMTTSFLGATGTTSASVTQGSSNFVYPVATNAQLPSSVTSLEYTSAIAATSPATSPATSTISTAVLPSITPSANSAGGVVSGGDLALINAPIAANGVVVSIYITNLAALQADYSSFAFPINVYSATCTTGCTTWTPDTAVTGTTAVYLTSTTGFLTFTLPSSSNVYYDITMDQGGSYYCTSVANPSTSLTPSFYFTAEPY